MSFYVTKTVLVGQKWFWSDQIYLDLTIMIWSWPKWNGHDQNEMVTSKMNWSGPNVIHFGRKSRFGPDQFILVVTISFWSRPNHYGQVQINLVRPKPFWTNQNCSGHIDGQGIRTDLDWLFLRIKNSDRRNQMAMEFFLNFSDIPVGIPLTKAAGFAFSIFKVLPFWSPLWRLRLETRWSDF